MANEPYLVELTLPAQKDLRDIFDHVRRRHGIHAAGSTLDEILEAISALEVFPFRGAIPPELEGLGSSRFRQIWSGQSRLIYRISDHQVVVMLIADGRRDLSALLERRMLNS